MYSRPGTSKDCREAAPKDLGSRTVSSQLQTLGEFSPDDKMVGLEISVKCLGYG